MQRQARQGALSWFGISTIKNQTGSVRQAARARKPDISTNRRYIYLLAFRAISAPLSELTIKLKIAFTIKERVSMKSVARRGRQRLQLERLNIIQPSWSAPITLTPAEPIPQAMLRHRYMLQSIAFDTTFRMFQPTALQMTAELQWLRTKSGCYSPMRARPASEPLPQITELILVPMATVDTPKANAIIFLLIYFTSYSSTTALSSQGSTIIRVMTKEDSPQTKQATKLLVSRAIQSVS